MDAVEFLKVRKRMCKANNTSCYYCSLATSTGSCLFMAQNEGAENVIVDRVEQWAKDHPVKTRQSEFLKMFPNTNKDKDGTLHACPEIFEPEIEIKCDGDCAICKFKRDYWLQEVE